MNIEQWMVGTVVITLLMSLLMPMAIPVPNTTAPICDLVSVFPGSYASLCQGGSPFNSSTTAQNATQLTQQQEKAVGQATSCAGSILGGLSIGGALGGFIGLGLGAGIGGLLGCVIVPAAFPAQATTFGAQVLSASKNLGLGDFLSAIVDIMQFVGGFFKFGPDFILYCVGLFPTDPYIALFGILFVSLSIFFLSIFAMKVARGVGII